MICIALGLGVLGFIAARKARRCGRAGFHGWGWHHHHRHGWHGGHGGHGWHGYGRGGMGDRHVLHMALARIDASPAQERAIIAEVDKLHERLHAARASMKAGRTDLAAAVRGPSLDDAALGAVLGRVDSASAEVRGAVLEAVRNIHAVLDDQQRESVAELIDGGWWRRPGGAGRGPGSPYRV